MRKAASGGKTKQVPQSRYRRTETGEHLTNRVRSKRGERNGEVIRSAGGIHNHAGLYRAASEPARDPIAETGYDRSSRKQSRRFRPAFGHLSYHGPRLDDVG